VAGLGWLGAVVAAGQLGLLPWAAGVVAVPLLLGWITASASMSAVLLAAERERARAEQDMQSGVAVVARDLVLAPVHQELSEYGRFRDALQAARGRA
jgi:hypothetical protein